MEKVKTHFGEVAKEFESIMRRLIPYYEQTPDTDKHSFYKKNRLVESRRRIL
jgi:hypothetical protein